MNKKLLISIILLICPIIFGCNSSYHEQSSLNQNWGRSYETARFNQIINPDAPDNTEPVTDLNGKAAMNTLDQYQDSFKTRQSTRKIYNIDLTGVGTR
ncbi:MAG: hypothetical protein PF690_04625 [Deltaproteobacteria bacterium]|nr:hypothetical protein [Deltaproteobacteria bacterium]